MDFLSSPYRLVPPSIGSLLDKEFVFQAFKDADAVYTMVPPDFVVSDYYDFSDKIHQNYQQAIKRNNIQYAFNLSSLGVTLAGVEPLTRVKILMTHPADIAEAAFSFLNTLSFSGRQIKTIISDVKTGGEIAAILSDAINKPLHWVEFPDDALLAGLIQNGFSKDAAETLIVAAGKAIRDGLFDEFRNVKYRLSESRKFDDFAKEFKMAYKFRD